MYLVVGANGFLGAYIIKNILERTDENIIAAARGNPVAAGNQRVQWVHCDISRREDVDLLCEQAGRYNKLNVIFLAAYHNPDLVEKNPKIAWGINVTSLSYAINRLGNARCLFYPSTDSVYGNSIGFYHFHEEDMLNPVNQYGRQKAAAESVVTGYGFNVVRYPFLISHSLAKDKKHFYDYIEESLMSGKEIKMFQDSYRSSLDFNTAARLLIDVIEDYGGDAPKVLNICGDADLSKYDVGLMIAEKLGVDKRLVMPVCMDDSDKIFEAARARSTLMDNARIKKLLGLKEIKMSL